LKKTRILILSGDPRLTLSLAGLFQLHGMDVLVPPASPAGREIDVVLAACDCLPNPWTLERARRAFDRLPCLLLSGSPVSGPYAAAGFKRGFFLGLPAAGPRIVDAVRALVG
jgi:hypothetical protein